ncbi:MAG: sigma 54-interacting transcriptional regulator [Dethiobacter sp.]|jgi:transcriptional regulator with PAS, ATPase and Fis domain|nr:sigma 54-interacting transcriptional regulator [Dethiobacter sp.]
MILEFLKNNTLLLTLFEKIYDSILIVDKNSYMLYINDRFQQIIAKEDMRGKKVEEIEPNSKFLEVLKSGKPIYNYRQLIETAGIEVVVSYFPIKLENETIGAIGVGRTISADHMYNLILNPDKIKQKPLFQTKSRSSLPVSFQSLIGEDGSFLKALFKGAAAAGTDANVLILGESGVGKEVFSRAIHLASSRSKADFVVVNCAAIPENLLESELFGYEPGAFTGASSKGKKGKLELAHNGTLFLDEIGDLPPHLQAKLLRAIQFKSFDRVGGNKPICVDIRIIAATNRNLWSMVKEEKFRPDLYYRLNVMPITIPPLKERRKDIIPLAFTFLSKLLDTQQVNLQFEFSEDALKEMLLYDWPGNIRELENVVEHAFVMSSSEGNPFILTRHLPGYLQAATSKNTNPEDLLAMMQEKRTLSEIIEKFEMETIKQTLKECDQNKTKTLKMLGISKGAFYQKLKKYNIN